MLQAGQRAPFLRLGRRPAPRAPQPQENLAQYVVDEAKAKRQQEMDTSGWERRFPRSCPRQDNCCDCGVFTVKFADYLVRARRAPVSRPAALAP